MNLAYVLTENEKLHVLEGIRNLFLAQGHKPKEEQIMLFLDNISSYGFPFQAIMAGLRALETENLKVIKLYDVKMSIEDKIEPEEYQNNGKVCQYCENTGAIFVKQVKEPRTSSTLSCCMCNKGKYLGNVMWNGEMEQVVKGKLVRVDTPKIFKKIQYQEYGE